MGEYAVKKRTQSRGQVNNMMPTPEMTNGIPNSMLSDVFAGKKSATSDMMGRRSNLAPSIAAKMSQAFGMDVSGVQVYRSDAMAGSSMHGMASGNKVVLGSDVDLNTMEGQAILGHELSHIRAQSMGIGTGSGLLQNTALEHQADSEGMMAARGMNISGESMGMNMGFGMAGVENLTPLSGGMSASAGAPMQAKKPPKVVPNFDEVDTRQHNARQYDLFDADMVSESNVALNEQMTSAERDAVIRYTGNDYSNDNNYLRGKELDEDADREKVQRDTALLKSGLGKYETKKSFTVYRFIDEDALPFMAKEGVDVQSEEALNGEILTDKACMSSSIDPDFEYNGDVVLEIRVPAHAHVGAPIMDHSEHSKEREFLLRPETRLRVTGEEKKTATDGRPLRVIKCDAIDSESPGKEK